MAWETDDKPWIIFWGCPPISRRPTFHVRIKFQHSVLQLVPGSLLVITIMEVGALVTPSLWRKMPLQKTFPPTHLVGG